MIAFLFAAVLAAAPTPSSVGCTLQQPTACPDARQLAADPQFQAELRRFVGNRQTRYLDERGHAYDEAMLLLQGPSEPARSVGGRTLLAACREHSSCEEKAAVLFQADGRLSAVGVLHTNCARLVHPGDCFEHFTLSIFTPDADDQGPLDILSQWAKDEVAANIASPGAPATFLDRVEQVAAAKPGGAVVAVASARPAPARVSTAPVMLAPPPLAQPQAAVAAPAVAPSPPAQPKPRTSKPRSKDWTWHWTPYS